MLPTLAFPAAAALEPVFEALGGAAAGAQAQAQVPAGDAGAEATDRALAADVAVQHEQRVWRVCDLLLATDAAHVLE